MKSIKEKVNPVLQDIQSRSGYKPVELQDHFGIVRDLGFSSLDIAELIALLEMDLGVDPFAEGVSIMDVRTIGQLHEVYAASVEQNQVEIG